MTTYRVMYQTTASYAVTVDIDDAGMTDAEARDAAREAAEEANAEQAPGQLCHQCSRDYDLGDFEQGDDEHAVWKD